MFMAAVFCGVIEYIHKYPSVLIDWTRGNNVIVIVPLKQLWWIRVKITHYCDVIMGAMASLITSLTIVYSIVYWGAEQRNIKAPRPWLLCGEFTGENGGFPAQMAINAEYVSIWWRHHAGSVSIWRSHLTRIRILITRMRPMA